jgi:hypothetical protein
MRIARQSEVKKELDTGTLVVHSTVSNNNSETCTHSMILKGPCHAIFDHFFSSNNSPLAPDTGLKPFWNMASYLQSTGKSTKSVHSGVNDTAVQQTFLNIFVNDPKHYRYCFLCGNMTPL